MKELLKWFLERIIEVMHVVVEYWTRGARYWKDKNFLLSMENSELRSYVARLRSNYEQLFAEYEKKLRHYKKLNIKYQKLKKENRELKIQQRILKPVNMNKFLQHVKQHVELNNSEKEQSTQDYLRDTNDEKLK